MTSPPGALELLDRDQAFGLVSEIDDHVLGGDAQDRALQNLVGGRRGEVAVIVEKILVAFGDLLVRLPVVLVYGHQASADHCFANDCRHLDGCGRQLARVKSGALCYHRAPSWTRPSANHQQTIERSVC